MRFWANCRFHVGDLWLWMHMIDVYWFLCSCRYWGHSTVGLYSMVLIWRGGGAEDCMHILSGIFLDIVVVHEYGCCGDVLFGNHSCPIDNFYDDLLVWWMVVPFRGFR